MIEKPRFILIAILTVGLILRLWKLNIPLLEFYPTRQVQTADITRNFYQNDFNILKPTVSYLGKGYKPFLIEFPGYNFLVATLYSVFGPHEYFGRLLSILGWAISCYFLFQIAKKYAGDLGAKAALFFYSFSPLSVLVSRSFQPDQWMLTLSISAIYFIIKWKENQKILLFIATLICASLAFLLKAQSVIFTIVPIYFAILTSNSRSKLLLIFYSFFALVPVGLWTAFAAIQNRATPETAEVFSLSNYFGWNIFLNLKYYSNIFGYEYNLVLLPVGLFLILIGLAAKLAKDQYFLYWWFWAVIIYFLIFNKLNMVHEYYHLPFLPIAAIFIGIGCEKLITNFKNLLIPKTTLIFIFSILIFVMMLPPTLERAYTPIERFRSVLETAQTIKNLTKSNDLIIGAMDGGPTLVYYSGRAGWLFDINSNKLSEQEEIFGLKVPNRTPIEELEDLRKKGATMFAAASKTQFGSNKIFADYMYKNYPLVSNSNNYVIFDIKNKINAN